MGLKGGDQRPLICGKLIMQNPTPIYFDGYFYYSSWDLVRVTTPGGWSPVYLKGCSWDGTGITFPEPGKYSMVYRIATESGSYQNLGGWMDVDKETGYGQYGGTDGGWTRQQGGQFRPSIDGAYIGWSGIGNFTKNAYVTPRIQIYVHQSDWGTPRIRVYPKINLPRYPVIEWFRISPNIGERSVAEWYYN